MESGPQILKYKKVEIESEAIIDRPWLLIFEFGQVYVFYLNY